MPDMIFRQIFDMTKVACVVILAVMLVRLCLHRAPRVFSYALWAVVLFRLLCPVSVEAPFSLIPAAVQSVQDAGAQAMQPQAMQSPAIQSPAIQSQVIQSPAIPSPAMKSPVPSGDSAAAIPPQEDGRAAVCSPVTAVWMAGIAVMLLRSGILLVRLRGRLIASVKLRDNIYLADDIASPFVMGILRPKIYLPSALTEAERGYILLHEQHHIRRGDPIVKLAAYTALCLHWFNPLVWAAFVLAERDMEMSCDEAVLRRLGGEVRADYAASLIRLATGRRMIAGAPLAFGEGDAMSRVKNLARWKKPALWVTVIAVLLCAAVTLCLVTNPVPRDTILWGGEYRLGEILYRAHDEIDWDADAYETAMLCITADLCLYERDPAGEWRLLGAMEPCENPEEWLRQYDIGGIADAYILHTEGGMSHLACRTKRGDVLYAVIVEDALFCLLRLESTFGGSHLTGEYHERSLARTVGGDVEIFHTWYNEKIPGYMIAAFRSDDLPYEDGVRLPSPDKPHMGFAVFTCNRDESGFRLLACHVYENAAASENGIFHCPDPAVLGSAGKTKPDRIFDVILLNNKDIEKTVRVWQYEDGTEMSQTASYLSGREMVLFSRENDRAGCRIRQLFYDAEGEQIDVRGVKRDETVQVWMDEYALSGQASWMDAVKWDTVLTTTHPDHPGVTFTYTPGQITAEDESGIKILLSGSPIWNAFFADVTGDGLADLCITANYGSGVTATMVSVYDCRKEQPYSLLSFHEADYALRMADGQLVCDKLTYGEREYLDTGSIAVTDGALVMTSRAVKMVPTAADVGGVFDAYLYLPAEGGSYRFERTDADVSSVTKGAMLHRFVEAADPQDVPWRVYSVKEYPDGSVVYAEAGEEYRALYRYSPPKAADALALAKIKADGGVVLEDGDVTAGRDRWQAFLARSERGEDASVEITCWYTLERGIYDAKYLAVYREDYPAMYKKQLTFRDGMYTLSWEEDGRQYVRSYRYLRRFEISLPSQLSAKKPETAVRYVLLHDKNVTWDALMGGLASARLEDAIDHVTVYGERLP